MKDKAGMATQRKKTKVRSTLPEDLADPADAAFPADPTATPFIHTSAIDEALDALVNSRAHAFITGRAGTGKSTLLRYFLDDANLKTTVVLAPTGVAALNVNGETIHHFFTFTPAMSSADVRRRARNATAPKKRLYRRLETIIIDEISMVRADLLDQIDEFLRLVRSSDAPFGGVRLVAFGDLYQLPPVVTNDERELFETQWESPYFFSSHVFERLSTEAIFDEFRLIELDRVFRQADTAYVDFLNRVRMCALGPADLDMINSHVIDPNVAFGRPNCPLFLTTTRRRASSINSSRLEQLRGREVVFHGSVSGEFPDSYQPTDEELRIKVGARIMMVANDPEGKWVNGSLGTVLEIHEGDVEVTVALDNPFGPNGGPGANGDLSDAPAITVGPYTWEAQYNHYDKETKSIERRVLGSFKQLPMRLSWAVTIHKAQGKTFDSVVVDLERTAFAHGQTYVALSRTRSLDGLELARPLRMSDIRLDRRVSKFMVAMRTKLARGSVTNEEIVGELDTLIGSGADAEIDYLATDDTASTRVITPHEVGTFNYEGVSFLGLRAYCHEREAERTFNVERIIAVRSAQPARSA